MMELETIKAVAVIGEGGFVALSAPILKPRGQSVSILLTHEQRAELLKYGAVAYGDLDYQGTFGDDALPTGYKDARRSRSATGWSNAENQWFDAGRLRAFVERAPNKRDCVGMSLWLQLLAAASEGKP